MYHQFNIQQLYFLPAQCIYVFCVDLRTNSDYFPIQHSLTGFCNRDGECLLRGTDWVTHVILIKFLNILYYSISGGGEPLILHLIISYPCHEANR